MNTKNLAQRLLAIMAEVDSVDKLGYNDFQNYEYAKESDYVRAIRPSLIKHGVLVLSDLVSMSKEETLTTVTMKFTLINVDNPSDTLVINMPGTGADKSDKGVYKAITGAKKYFINNTMLLPTNDDPEASEVDGARSGGYKGGYQKKSYTKKAETTTQQVNKAVEAIQSEASATVVSIKQGPTITAKASISNINVNTAKVESTPTNTEYSEGTPVAVTETKKITSFNKKLVNGSGKEPTIKGDW